MMLPTSGLLSVLRLCPEPEHVWLALVEVVVLAERVATDGGRGGAERASHQGQNNAQKYLENIKARLNYATKQQQQSSVVPDKGQRYETGN